MNYKVSLVEIALPARAAETAFLTLEANLIPSRSRRY
jgi:hypothetical protein